MDNRILYNCYGGNEEPDWSLYSHLELAGCTSSDEGETTADVPAHEAEFFTIYGRRKGEPYAEAITDCPSALRALKVGATLARRSGLVLQVDPSLECDPDSANDPHPLEQDRPYTISLFDHGDVADARTQERVTATITVYPGNIAVQFKSERDDGPQYGEVYAELYHGELAVNLYDINEVGGGEGPRFVLAEPNETCTQESVDAEEVPF